MSSTVYLIQKPRANRDLTDLTRFGNVVTIFDERAQPQLMGKAGLAHVERVLRNFDPQRDYIVWAGGGIAAALFIGAALFQMHTDSIKFLWWSRRLSHDGERMVEAGEYRANQLPINFDVLELEEADF